jgi:predicted MFS family arabinose efflux permease
LQQQNVIRGNYLAAAITPFAIAAGEVATVLIVVSGGLQSIPWVGAGGAIGATSAMWIHRRFARDR